MESITERIKTLFVNITAYLRDERTVYILGVFLFTRLLVIFVGMMAFVIFPSKVDTIYFKRSQDEVMDLEVVFHKFDTTWYTRTASEGYPQKPFVEGTQETWGFMPLYPIAIRGVHEITRLSYFWSGTIISNLSALIAVLIIFKLLSEKFEKDKVTQYTILAFLLSAGTYFLSLVYTEGFYLLFVALTFYLSHKKQYFLAIVIAGLGTVARQQGLLLFTIPTIELILEHRFKLLNYIKYIPAYILGALPLALFMYYLYITSGEPLAFLKIQTAWGSSSVYPLQGIIGIIQGNVSSGAIINLVFICLYFVIYLLNIRRIPLSYSIFTLGYFLLSTQNETLYGTTRYALAVLPLWIAVGFIAKTYPNIYKAFVVFNIVVFVISLAAFVAQIYTTMI